MWSDVLMFYGRPEHSCIHSYYFLPFPVITSWVIHVNILGKTSFVFSRSRENQNHAGYQLKETHSFIKLVLERDVTDRAIIFLFSFFLNYSLKGWNSIIGKQCRHYWAPSHETEPFWCCHQLHSRPVTRPRLSPWTPDDDSSCMTESRFEITLFFWREIHKYLKI